MLLDFDRTGRYLGLIATKGRDDPETCCESVFQHWLEGNGVQPATWGTLIRLLEDCQCNVIAQEVKEALGIPTSL